MTADYTHIVEGCRRHDRKAQRALYEAMAPMAMGVCMRYSSDREEAQDLMQDGFVKVFEHVGRMKDVEHLSAWVYKVMLNVCLKNYHRKMRRKRAEMEVTEQVELPLDPFAAEEIVAALQQLAPAQRQVFNLMAVEGYNYTDAAREMRCTEVNVRALYSRARMEMRNLLRFKV
ncbi:MAG: RNA polymerase sigma factor [Bacteroidales bacterium]|nr:RNA polymerase sigma factor [Bacteroidales bacterium]MBR5092268.1 RNA polymerase sigma factor [Bacteroidales bacterium]